MTNDTSLESSCALLLESAKKFANLKFQTMTFVRSKDISLKYQRFTTLGSKDIGIRKSEFVAKSQFLFANFLTLLSGF